MALAAVGLTVAGRSIVICTGAVAIGLPSGGAMKIGGGGRGTVTASLAALAVSSTVDATTRQRTSKPRSAVVMV
jgi:hypothetical protein